MESSLPNSHDSVYSSCTDGTEVLGCSLASGKPVQLFKGYPSNIFISFDISSNDHVICAGTEKLMMHCWYFGMPELILRTCLLPKSHLVHIQRHIVMISLKYVSIPVIQAWQSQSSTDGLVNVFDISANEGDALVTTCNSVSSVSIGWSGKDYKQIYCMTHDERILLVGS